MHVKWLQAPKKPVFTFCLTQDWQWSIIKWFNLRNHCFLFLLCTLVLVGGEKGNLAVVATVFDKLNQVYKEYLEAEQAYTVVLHTPFSLHISNLTSKLDYMNTIIFTDYSQPHLL